MAQLLKQGTGFYYEGVLNVNPEVCIDWFDEFETNNKYNFLSNFYEGAPFYCWGELWQTSEHAYAASKVWGVDDETYYKIQQSSDPQEAKTLGRTAARIRPDWEEVKLQVMRHVIKSKFKAHGFLMTQLLNTGNAYLQEGTFWNDKVWGVDLMDEDGNIILDPLKRQGHNWLGMCLMELRSQIRLGIATSKVG